MPTEPSIRHTDTEDAEPRTVGWQVGETSARVGRPLQHHRGEGNHNHERNNDAEKEAGELVPAVGRLCLCCLGVI